MLKTHSGGKEHLPQLVLGKLDVHPRKNQFMPELPPNDQRPKPETPKLLGENIGIPFLPVNRAESSPFIPSHQVRKTTQLKKISTWKQGRLKHWRVDI